EVQIILQVNGKVRSKSLQEKGLSKEEMLALAKDDERIQSWIAGKTIVKEIVVPDKLVNLVVE
ncbi:MAG TPA: hypothetical protein VJ869_06280, partial [Sphaerochaeta sp.]|nr:hypothetical protein [Sphaerochaeta sp.]